MAATGSRTLKLSILADVENLTKNLKSGSKDVGTFGDQISDFGKKAAVAFAAAGAAIGAFAVTSIKNALADEAAQRKLEETLRASTAATDAQIASVGAWIDKTSLAIGVTDDQLRPAFSRLARSTNDVEEAQKLLNLSLDVSAATGKPLETVANALGKAYDGNAASLGRLGLGLDANLLKSKDTDAIMSQLTKTFGNFAENEAETTAKKFERVKIAIDEAQESIGAALLPLVEKLAMYLIETLVPNMNLFIAALTGKSGIVDGIDKSGEAAYEWGGQVRGLIKTIIDLKDELQVVAAIIAAMWVTSKIFAFVTAIQGLIATMILLRTTAIGTAIAAAFATGGANIALATAALLAVGLTGYNLMNLTSGDSTDSGFSGSGLGKNPIQSGTYLNQREKFVIDDTSDVTDVGGSVGKTVNSTNVGMSKIDPMKLFNDLTSLKAKTQALTDAFANGTITKLQLSNRLAPLVTQRNSLQNQVDDLLGNSGAFYGAQSARAGEAATTNINVTVNGAIDSEGTARTVVNTLNDSFYRGTLGAGALVSAFDK